MESGFDLQKVYKDSMQFLMHEKHRLMVLPTEKSNNKLKSQSYSPNVNYMDDGGDNYTGDIAEPKFEDDVMFSSANITGDMMSQSTCYMTKSVEHRYGGKSEPDFSADAVDESSSHFMSDIEIKKEPLTDEEMETEPPDSSYIQHPSSTSQDMFSSNSDHLHSEDFPIKQEQLGYEDESGMEELSVDQNAGMSESIKFSEWRFQNAESVETSKPTEVRRSHRPKKPKLDDNFISDAYAFDDEGGNSFIDGHLDYEQDPDYYLDYSRRKNYRTTNKYGSNDLVFPQSGNMVDESLPCSFSIPVSNSVDQSTEIKQIQVNIFRCSVCGALFTYNSLLQRHMKKHTNEYPFRCKHCDCGFITQYSHDLHSKLHTEDKSYLCGICGENFQTRKDLKDHHTIHKKESDKLTAKAVLEAAAAKKKEELKETRPRESCPFGCSICDYYTSDFNALADHVLTEHKKKKFCFCEICCKKFENNDKMICHLAVHEEGSFQCGLCDVDCVDQETLLRHLDVHELAKPYMCTLCNAKFIALPRLQTHVINKHSVHKGYTCRHCGKQFHQESTLTNHMRVHTGEISFKCNVCSKGFRVKERLDRHMREHEDYNNIPYPCSMVRTDNNSQIMSWDKVQNGQGLEVEQDSMHTKTGSCNSEIVSQNSTIVQDQIKSEPTDNSQEQEAVEPTHTPSTPPQIWSENVVDVTGPGSYLSQLKERFQKKRKQSQTTDLLKTEILGNGDCALQDENGTSVNSGDNEDEDHKVTGLDKSLEQKGQTFIKTEPQDFTPDVNNQQNPISTIIPCKNDKNEIKNPLPQLGMEKITSPQKTMQSVGSSAFSIAIKKICKTPENGVMPTVNLETGDFQKTLKIQMNIHQCKICGTMFAYKNQLHKHMQKHTGDHPIKCEVCGKGFSSPHSYSVHYRVHSGERPYECKICGRPFRQKHSLNCHVLTHSDIKPYECDQCSRKYRTEGELKRHKQLHMKSIPYSCGICGLDSSKLDDIAQHVSDKHFAGKAFVCNICSKRFERGEDCDLHMSYHAESINTIQCGVCGQDFLDKSEMMLHLGDHVDGKPFKCNLCSAKFITFSDLQFHLSDHKELKVYDCSVCKKEFLSESHLRDHVRIHTGELPFKCDKCNKAFRLKAGLDRHLRIHSGEKPFKCDYCDKTFATSSNRLSHHATHKKEKIFNCSLCEETFNRKGKLKAHEMEHKKNGMQVLKNTESQDSGSSAKYRQLKSPTKAKSDLPTQEPGDELNYTQSGKQTEEHICVECGETFKRKFKLKKHIKLCHGDMLTVKLSGFRKRKGGNPKQNMNLPHDSISSSDTNLERKDIYSKFDSNSDKIGVNTVIYDEDIRNSNNWSTYKTVNIKQEAEEADLDTTDMTGFTDSNFMSLDTDIKQEIQDPAYNVL